MTYDVFGGTLNLVLSISIPYRQSVCKVWGLYDIFSRSRYIRGSQSLKSRLRNPLGHAPFWPFFIFGLLSLTVNPHAKFEVCIFSRSILGGSQNLKVSHVTRATLPCDILYVWISTSWSPVELQLSTWLELLFWRYCRCKILAFWLENASSALFLAVFLGGGILTPKIVISLF